MRIGLIGDGAMAAALVALMWASATSPVRGQATQPTATVDAARAAELIVHEARITTLDPAQPEAEALAVREGVIVAVGTEDEVMRWRGPGTRLIDASNRRLIPGLNDSHTHAVRGGRFYTLELRWDGVDTLARGLAMIREQAQRTPEGQWVRVIGGWSPFQFQERRMPTIAELNDAAPDTPVFVLYLYSQGFLNRAGVEALGLDENTPVPWGSRYEFVDGGAILHAEPNPTLLYRTIGALPQLPAEQMVNSTRHFYRELNRFGLTSVIDAGGGGHMFPDDYTGSEHLAHSGGLPMRVSFYLFPQRPGQEREDFQQWMAHHHAGHDHGVEHEHGYELEGAGEFLVWDAGDFENFLADRPELREGYRPALVDVTRMLVRKRWPIRIHATYDESITQILDVFEQVFEEENFHGRWIIDHAETIGEANLQRVRALGGGIAIQNRMAFAGEYFLERYGADAAAYAPPVRRMLDLGIPVGAGTDATRVSSHNPWLSLYWLVSGRTVGGTRLWADDNRLSRLEALRMFTVGSAWFSGEEHVKGRIAPGQYADFAILNADFFTVSEEGIRDIESLLTVVGGEPVYAAGALAAQVSIPALPPIEPAWSPVIHFGGYQADGTEEP